MWNLIVARIAGIQEKKVFFFGNMINILSNKSLVEIDKGGNFVWEILHPKSHLLQRKTNSQWNGPLDYTIYLAWLQEQNSKWFFRANISSTIIWVQVRTRLPLSSLTTVRHFDSTSIFLKPASNTNESPNFIARKVAMLSQNFRMSPYNYWWSYGWWVITNYLPLFFQSMNFKNTSHFKI